MYIALNAHLLSLSQTYRGAGISWYTYHLLQNLGAAAPQWRYTAYLHDRAFVSTQPNLTPEFSHWPTYRPPMRIAWEQFVLPFKLQRTRPDLLHALAFVAPIITPIPTVITIYDLSFLRFPEAFRPFNRWYLSHFTAYSVKRARQVITISESSRQDVINLLGKPAQQVHTVYCGAEAAFRPLPAAEVAAFRAQHHLPDTFLLYLGTLEPRKNLNGLIRAYAAWQAQTPNPPLLVIAGGKGWYYQEIFALVESLGLTSHIRFAGYIPAAELPWWYNAASLFVYPSFFEGFGLPILEAMACGTPVITSNISSLPEVAGEAAWLINPHDTPALSTAMQQVMAQPDRRATMREQGLAQAARFQWSQTAQETVKVYEQAIDSKR